MNQFDKFILNILNITQDDIISIHSFKNDHGILTIHIKPIPKTVYCPFCSNNHLLSKGYRQLKVKSIINDIESCDIVYFIKRFKCKNCGVSFSDNFHIAPSNARVSYATIQKTMDLLKSPQMTFKLASNILSISPQTVLRIFDNYCKISSIKLPEVICIDEVYTKNSDFANSKYSCLFYDFYNQTLIDITPSRKKDYLINYLDNHYSKSERDHVKYICIDMYKPYKIVSQAKFKNAIICVDSFHVIKTLNDCVNNVRMRIMKLYDSSSHEYYLLKKFKNLFLSSNFNLDNKPKFNKKLNRYINYRGLLELLLNIHPDLRKAYYLKESYITFNSKCNDPTLALVEIHRYYDQFLQSNIPEFYVFITALGNWDQEIANSFTYYRGRRISNGIAESVNSKVSTILFNSKGIRNSERRKKRIMYVINQNNICL